MVSEGAGVVPVHLLQGPSKALVAAWNRRVAQAVDWIIPK